ncbi:hypothetical protein CONLIGDRAFT_662315 [Coniochaeta ligniaria NRRL 30616]|uniref:Zip-domain-containing protein n=1 Tax=Coniochaeta ligniaria NRRL 30616 TaxID=1408157 RepID=A0A1J7IPM0_9PEZI|nr:hypothetical protein CONLIGDRAFT_662315 [Coniochaeta ligniaria NRRL 30616]
MSPCGSTTRTSILYGLVAALHFETVSASLTRPSVYQRAPQVTDTPDPTITAVSSCYLHSTAQHCKAGTLEFRISGSATASSYTDCHSHGDPTFCMAPTGEVQIILAIETASDHTVAPTPARSASALTAVSECHLHGLSLYCMAGATEYVVHTTATATTDIPPAFTGCHTHESETFCLTPSEDDIEISLEAETDTDDHNNEASSSAEQNCHFHAGVEHCVGGDGEAVKTCDRVQRDYNIPLRVGLLFAMLATSSIGVFAPIFVASFVSPHNVVFTILRQFGTGIVISTAFIHLYTHATLMFKSDCLGELAYESTSSAILMAGIFLSFLVEYLGIRLVQWHGAKSTTTSVETLAADGVQLHPQTSTEMVNITVLEAGVIFHSLLIGLILVVASDSFLLTLFAVIVFHQMFEGIALGTRIAALGLPVYHSHGLGHQSQFHESKQQSNPSTLAEELGAASDHQHPPNTPPTQNVSSVESDTDGATTMHKHEQVRGCGVSMKQKLLLAAAFALVTPLGMAIGIGVLHTFNGNDPSTIIAIGTLDALSAGILVWVGVVEMWAHDWMLGGEMTTAGLVRTALGMLSLVASMALMSLLGKWA